MAVYMVFWQDSVDDRDGLNAYQAKAGPTLGGRPVTPRVVTDNCEHLEGDWNPGRMVILEFPTKEDARAWYDSPEYSEVKKLRHAATTGGGGVMVDVMQIPGQ
jgi:uncharacterized protein (DUF1330 family)